LALNIGDTDNIYDILSP